MHKYVVMMYDCALLKMGLHPWKEAIQWSTITCVTMESLIVDPS